MKRTRQILVLTLVATALCADGITTVTPRVLPPLAAAGDPIARFAATLGSKLSSSFSRPTKRVCFAPTRRDGLTVVTQPAPSPTEPATVHLAESSPFQYRLPPPAH